MADDQDDERARHERASEILLDVRDLRGTAREAAISDACGSDVGLRELVASLAVHVEDDADGPRAGALEGAIASMVHQAAGSGDRARLTRIGRYRILGLLGTGGMGEVFEAQQDRPRRRVAIKVLRPGVSSREVVARFEREAQVLGELQHPGIAQVHEAGVADSEPAVPGDVAFIAMELVRGLPLTEHARERSLRTRERLELLARVCDAVHHAHLRGFVHRDLKPSNVLVDAHGQPKVLDFGVARASSSDLTLATLHTTAGQLIGTIPYMSPEQAGGDVMAIDARSDVYALGVVACELVTGRLPHDLRKVSIPDALRMIREDEPTRVGSIDATLRGDVETIIAKALEKDPRRRYQSAAELSADIRRHIGNEPILARPPSTSYQLAKFARRNRTLVTAVVVAFLGLSLGALLLDRARRREMAQREAADRSALAADSERRTALEQAYLASVTAGIAALEEDNVRAAVSRLDAAPVALRGWEWRHARARLDDSTAHLPLPHEGKWMLAWDPADGRLGATNVDWSSTSTVMTWDVASGRQLARCSVPVARETPLDAACLPFAMSTLQVIAGKDSATFTDPSTSRPLLVLPRLPGSAGTFSTRIVRDRPDLCWGEEPGRIGWIRVGSSEWTSTDTPHSTPLYSWTRTVDPAGQRIAISIADRGQCEIRNLADVGSRHSAHGAA